MPASSDNNDLTKSLYGEIATLLTAAQSQVRTAVNTAMVQTYWQIGRLIVEEESRGQERADYGDFLLRQLAKKLTADFGKGFGRTNLNYFRQFYLSFPIVHSVSGESVDPQKGHSSGDESPALRPELSWTHYRHLLKVKDKKARDWYMHEAANENWATRALERQINALHYERLLSSREKGPVTEEAREQIGGLKPQDILRDPYVLEFLQLKERPSYSERDLETALIDQLQDFLLELGKGFSFVSRQKRISLDGEHFFIDLVFYNYLLKCFVLIDLYPMGYVRSKISLRLYPQEPERRESIHQLFQRSSSPSEGSQRGESKVNRSSTARRIVLLRSVPISRACNQTRKVSQNRLGEKIPQRSNRRLSHGVKIGKLTHQDIGQLDSYVRIYEDQYRGEGDNPTIGLILCSEKNEAIARYSVLSDHETLFASKYQMILPSEEELARELEKEIKQIERGME